MQARSQSDCRRSRGLYSGGAKALTPQALGPSHLQQLLHVLLIQRRLLRQRLGRLGLDAQRLASGERVGRVGAAAAAPPAAAASGGWALLSRSPSPCAHLHHKVLLPLAHHGQLPGPHGGRVLGGGGSGSIAVLAAAATILVACIPVDVAALLPAAGQRLNTGDTGMQETLTSVDGLQQAAQRAMNKFSSQSSP